MNFRARAFSLEEEGRLRKLTTIRMIVATLVVCAAIMVLQHDDKIMSVVALYGLLGVHFISTGIVCLGFRIGFMSFGKLLWIEILTDIIVLSLIIHCMGGSSSYFTILYVLPILVGGIYFQLSGGLVTALLATSAYIIYSSLELSGNLPSSTDGMMVAQQDIYRPLLKGYIHMVVFTLTGVMSGFVSRHIQSKGRELAERERELRHMQLSTDSIIHNMSSGLIVADMEGTVLTVNPAARSILGVGIGGTLEGITIADLKENLSPLADELERVIETRIPRRRGEISIVRGDGTSLPLGLSISILMERDGGSSGVIALFQDLTEVRRMREKIRQADKMAAIGRLSASIAHEVRAPLASICGSIEMLQGELDLSGENRELMELILQESDRLDNIISDFLEFARMKRPNFSSIDVEKCLKEVLTLLKHSSAMHGGVEINVDCEGSLERVMADDEQIRQVFVNLANNAVEAMNEGGMITVRISSAREQLDAEKEVEDCVRIDFENDGKPIPKEIMPHLFEPFFTTKTNGTGLGLAIAARIVESHNGIIKVENIDDCRTVFSVLIPVRASSAGEAEDEVLLETFACL